MSKIKKFFEFFDDEDLKARHEIDYLTGEIKNYAKKIDNNFKDESIENLLSKLTYTFPFMFAFLKASNSNEGELKFSNFKVLVKHHPEDKFYNFIATDETIMVVLGIRILNNNKYDVYVLVDDINDEDSRIIEEHEVSYQELCYLISNPYIQSLIDVDFYDLVRYKFEEMVIRSN